MLIEVILIKDAVAAVWDVYRRMTADCIGEPPTELEFYLCGILTALQNYRFSHGGRGYIGTAELTDILRRCLPGLPCDLRGNCDNFRTAILEEMGVDDDESQKVCQTVY